MTAAQCRVASIDVGRRNLALCVYDANERTVTHWRVYDTGLGDTAYNAERWCATVAALVRSWPPADTYLVERQVPQPHNHKNLIIEALVHAIVGATLHGTAIAVSPADVSGYFLLPKGAKHAKKRAATSACVELLRDRRARIRVADENLSARFTTPGVIAKRDDLADCLLQCIYWCEHNATGAHSLANAHYCLIEPSRYTTTAAAATTTPLPRRTLCSSGTAAAAAAAAADTYNTTGGAAGVAHQRHHGRRRGKSNTVDLAGDGDGNDESATSSESATDASVSCSSRHRRQGQPRRRRRRHSHKSAACTAHGTTAARGADGECSSGDRGDAPVATPRCSACTTTTAEAALINYADVDTSDSSDGFLYDRTFN